MVKIYLLKLVVLVLVSCSVLSVIGGTSSKNTSNKIFSTNDNAIETVLEIQIPTSRIVFQRNNANRGMVRVEGKSSQDIEIIEARLVARGAGQGKTTRWRKIERDLALGTFSGSVEGGGGWYNLEIRFKRGKKWEFSTVERVGIGEVFVVVGHSVAQGGNINIEGSLDDRVSTVALDPKSKQFDSLYLTTGNPMYLPPPTFSNAATDVVLAPFGHGSYFWSKFGEYVAKKQNVPVLVFNAAFGGTSLEHWAKSSDSIYFEHGFVRAAIRMPYINLKNTLTRYISLTGIRALLADQGHNDAGQKDPDVIVNNYRRFVMEARKDLNYPQLAVVVNLQSPPNNTAVRQAQESMLKESGFFSGPDYDIGMVKADRYDEVHLSESGLWTAARLWSDALNYHFFKESKPWMPVH